MGRRGPAPKPAHLRAIQGNAGRRPLPSGGPPVFTPLESVPEPPEYLGAVGVRTWRRYASELISAGIVTSADLHVLAAFCDAWERWEECTADVRTRGSILECDGRRIRNPAGRCADDAWKIVRECSALLGLDPQSRARLEVPAAPDEENPFLEFLKADKPDRPA